VLNVVGERLARMQAEIVRGFRALEAALEALEAHLEAVVVMVRIAAVRLATGRRSGPSRGRHHPDGDGQHRGGERRDDWALEGEEHSLELDGFHRRYSMV